VVNKWRNVSEYQITHELPSELKSALPSIEELEAELEGKKETVMLGEPVLQFIDLEAEFDKFVQVRCKADLKSLSEAKTKKVHRLLEEIEKIIGDGYVQ